MKQGIISALFALLIGISAHAEVIVGTDFSGRTISGSTASNISFTANGIVSPGSSLVAIEDETNGTRDDTTENGGLFDTDNTADHFAFDLNVENEDGWYVDIPIVLADGVSSIELSSLDLSVNNFSNSGGRQSSSSARSRFDAQLVGSISGTNATTAAFTARGATQEGGLNTTWVLSNTLDASETWILRINAPFVNASGNNTGINSFTLNGTVVYEPSLSISQSAASSELTITYFGIIQESSDLGVSDPWADIDPQPSSPWVFTPAAEKMFYRIKP